MLNVSNKLEGTRKNRRLFLLAAFESAPFKRKMQLIGLCPVFYLMVKNLLEKEA